MTEMHVGSNFDDLLREDGLLDEVEAVAAERVRTYIAAEPSVRLRWPVVDPESLAGRSQT